MNGAADRISGIRIEPGAREWVGLIHSGWKSAPQRLGSVSLTREAGRRMVDAAGRFREQLGLPTDRPVIMTGHQAEFWHPGILAKYLAAHAAAGATGAAAASVVVDQDANRPGEVRYPIRGEGGRLTVGMWRALGGADELADRGVPTCRIGASAPTRAPTPEAGGFAAPSVGAGLARIHGALAGRAGERDAAHQVAMAVCDCLPREALCGHAVYATQLAKTDLFALLVESMRADPGRCFGAYNDAVAAHPDGHVAPLGADELPLWRLPAVGEAKPRERVRGGSMGSIAATDLAPRALLMTALLRWAGCDLFIHGTGGGAYDRITEQWMRLWLGVTLGASAVVTATVRLPIEYDAPGPEEIDRAVWLAHRARHDPGLLGDAGAAKEKENLKFQISNLKRTGGDVAGAFRRLHELLGRVRAERGEVLARLEREARVAAERRGDAAVAYARTWACSLYPAEDLEELRRRVEGEFVGG